MREPRLPDDWFSSPSFTQVFVDADDTLWRDGAYYGRLRRATYAIVTEAGYQPTELHDEIQRAREVAGLGRRGYADALGSVLRQLTLSPAQAVAFDAAVAEFLDQPVELFAGVREGLEALASRRLVLLTMGLEEEQRGKLHASGLAGVFSDVIIVPRKGIAELGEIYRARQLNGAEVISIGNSVVHDVLPAVHHGSAAVWLNLAENRHGRNAELPGGACEVTSWDAVQRAQAVAWRGRPTTR